MSFRIAGNSTGAWVARHSRLPSRFTGKQTVKDEKGEWTGEWVRGPDGEALDDCCHYILTDGVLNFCGDCTHALRGQSVPLPELPEWMRDAT